jgi:hypothetical protein
MEPGTKPEFESVLSDCRMTVMVLVIMFSIAENQHKGNNHPEVKYSTGDSHLFWLSKKAAPKGGP